MRVPPRKKANSSQTNPREAQNKKLETNLSETNLSVRTCNTLEDRGIHTVRDLLNSKARDLMTIKNFGNKTLTQVYAMLEGLGFYRAGHEPEEDVV